MDPDIKKLYRAILIWGDKVECFEQSYAIGDQEIKVFRVYIKGSDRTARNRVAVLVAPEHSKWYKRVLEKGDRMDARWVNF